MIVRHKGKQSSVKSLPGGGPQGTLLGLLLFIVLINDVGFEGQENNTGEIITSKKNMKTVNEMHLKYVDDLTLAESINLPAKTVYVPESERPLPDNFHAKTGHTFPVENSRVYQQLVDTKNYAKQNDMKINYKKSKLMLFNPCTAIDFIPDFELEKNQLEIVEEMKLLGIIIRSDLKWGSNTEYIVKKANSRLWTMRRLKNLGACDDDLLDVYTKQIRSVLELAVPVWQSGLKQAQKLEIERVQKSALHIVLGKGYVSYKQALKTLNFESLEARRLKLCLKFAKKAERHDKHKQWFKPNTMTVNTRQLKTKYCEVQARLSRFKDSPISYLTNMLNEHYAKK